MIQHKKWIFPVQNGIFEIEANFWARETNLRKYIWISVKRNQHQTTIPNDRNRFKKKMDILDFNNVNSCRTKWINGHVNAMVE